MGGATAAVGAGAALYTDAETERRRHGALSNEDATAILERGFRGFVEDLNAKKLEELRKKILESMGLTEEQLEEMPADQRAEVEQLVAQEIQRRLRGGAALNDTDAPTLGFAPMPGGPVTGGASGSGPSLLAIDPTLFAGQNLPRHAEERS